MDVLNCCKKLNKNFLLTWAYVLLVEFCTGRGGAIFSYFSFEVNFASKLNISFLNSLWMIYFVSVFAFAFAMPNRNEKYINCRFGNWIYFAALLLNKKLYMVIADATDAVIIQVNFI